MRHRVRHSSPIPNLHPQMPSTSPQRRSAAASTSCSNPFLHWLHVVRYDACKFSNLIMMIAVALGNGRGGFVDGIAAGHAFPAFHLTSSSPTFPSILLKGKRRLSMHILTAYVRSMCAIAVNPWDPENLATSRRYRNREVGWPPSLKQSPPQLVRA